ncbi:putative TIR-NBS-LRR resistance protein, partial [Trifolium pratense]
MLFVTYYSCPDNITLEGCQDHNIILEPGNNVEVRVVFGEGFIVDKTTVSLLYDEPVDKEMERFPVVDEEYVIVSGNDNNNVTVSGADNEVVNQFGE